MHVVTGSDENYVVGVLVLLASLAQHNPEARVTVLALDWSDDSKARLDRLAGRYDIDLSRLDIAPTDLPPVPLRRKHLTPATLMRLTIPDLLPDVDRVIYLDCDMVVTGPLDAAWQVDLGDAPVAAVPCPSPTPAFLDLLGLQKGDYVNAGFLVMNLSHWRRTTLGARCVEALLAGAPQHFGDEAVLNDLCRGRIVHLPPGFNVYALRPADQPVLDRPGEIRVIHYVVKPKPWSAPTTFGVLWHRVAAPVADLLPQQRPAGWRQTLRDWNNLRRAWTGWLAGKPHYRQMRVNGPRIAAAEHALLASAAQRTAAD